MYGIESTTRATELAYWNFWTSRSYGSCSLPVTTFIPPTLVDEGVRGVAVRVLSGEIHHKTPSPRDCVICGAPFTDALSSKVNNRCSQIFLTSNHLPLREYTKLLAYLSFTMDHPDQNSWINIISTVHTAPSSDVKAVLLSLCAENGERADKVMSQLSVLRSRRVLLECDGDTSAVAGTKRKAETELARCGDCKLAFSPTDCKCICYFHTGI